MSSSLSFSVYVRTYILFIITVLLAGLLLFASPTERVAAQGVNAEEMQSQLDTLKQEVSSLVDEIIGTPSISLVSPNGTETAVIGTYFTLFWWPFDVVLGVNHPGNITLYLDEKIDDEFQTVGHIVDGNGPSLIEIDSEVSVISPGDYYLRIVNEKTGAEDRTDGPITFIEAEALYVGHMGPEVFVTDYTTYKEAREHCLSSAEANTDVLVWCTWNGTLMYGVPIGILLPFDFEFVDTNPDGAVKGITTLINTAHAATESEQRVAFSIAQDLRAIEFALGRFASRANINAWWNDTSFGIRSNPFIHELVAETDLATYLVRAPESPSADAGQYRYDNDGDTFSCGQSISRGANIFIRVSSDGVKEELERLLDDDANPNCGKLTYNDNGVFYKLNPITHSTLQSELRAGTREQRTVSETTEQSDTPLHSDPIPLPESTTQQQTYRTAFVDRCGYTDDFYFTCFEALRTMFGGSSGDGGSSEQTSKGNEDIQTDVNDELSSIAAEFGYRDAISGKALDTDVLRETLIQAAMDGYNAGYRAGLVERVRRRSSANLFTPLASLAEGVKQIAQALGVNKAKGIGTEVADAVKGGTSPDVAVANAGFNLGRSDALEGKENRAAEIAEQVRDFPFQGMIASTLGVTNVPEAIAAFTQGYTRGRESVESEQATNISTSVAQTPTLVSPPTPRAKPDQTTQAQQNTALPAAVSPPQSFREDGFTAIGPTAAETAIAANNQRARAVSFAPSSLTATDLIGMRIGLNTGYATDAVNRARDALATNSTRPATTEDLGFVSATFPYAAYAAALGYDIAASLADILGFTTESEEGFYDALIKDMQENPRDAFPALTEREAEQLATDLASIRDQQAQNAARAEADTLGIVGGNTTGFGPRSAGTNSGMFGSYGGTSPSSIGLSSADVAGMRGDFADAMSRGAISTSASNPGTFGLNYGSVSSSVSAPGLSNTGLASMPNAPTDVSSVIGYSSPEFGPLSTNTSVRSTQTVAPSTMAFFSDLTAANIPAPTPVPTPMPKPPVPQTIVPPQVIVQQLVEQVAQTQSTEDTTDTQSGSGTGHGSSAFGADGPLGGLIGGDGFARGFDGRALGYGLFGAMKDDAVSVGGMSATSGGGTNYGGGAIGSGSESGGGGFGGHSGSGMGGTGCCGGGGVH